MRRVPVKTVQQQADLTVHRVRSQLVRERTARVNALRELLYEFGVVMPKGRRLGLRWLADNRASDRSSDCPSGCSAWCSCNSTPLRQPMSTSECAGVEVKEMVTPASRAVRLIKVPPWAAPSDSAGASLVGDASMAATHAKVAWLPGAGAPATSALAARVRMGPISKPRRCVPRTLLIHGARNLRAHGRPIAVDRQMLERRPFNVVVTAVAHKLARIMWAMAAHGMRIAIRTGYPKAIAKAASTRRGVGIQGIEMAINHRNERACETTRRWRSGQTVLGTSGETQGDFGRARQ